MPNENHLTTRSGTAEAPALLNTIEAASELRISKRALQDLVAERKIGFIKWGRNIRFDRVDLARFIDSNRCQPIGWKGESNRGGSR